MGGEDDSGLSDGIIKNFLWDSYFDIEQTVQWSIGVCSEMSSRFEVRIHAVRRRTREAKPGKGTER